MEETPWIVVHPLGQSINIPLGKLVKYRLFWQYPSDEAVGVLIASPFEGGKWMGIEQFRASPLIHAGFFQELTIKELRTVVTSNGLEALPEACRPMLAFQPVKGLDDAFLAFILQEEDIFIAGLAFGERKKGFPAAFGANNQIHFPMSGLHPSIRLRRTLFYAIPL